MGAWHFLALSLGGVLVFFFEGGGWKCQFYFYGHGGDFSELCENYCDCRPSKLLSAMIQVLSFFSHEVCRQYSWSWHWVSSGADATQSSPLIKGATLSKTTCFTVFCERRPPQVRWVSGHNLLRACLKALALTGYVGDTQPMCFADVLLTLQKHRENYSDPKVTEKCVRQTDPKATQN